MMAPDEFFEADPRASREADTPQLDLAGYAGPLDLLLELAQRQRLDLARLSIVALIEQFAAAVEQAVARHAVPLARLGDWLVMAATLLLLRSRLLLPPDTAAAQAAVLEADALRRQLAEGDFIRRVARWLEARPQLGRDVFGRGAPAGEAPAELPQADLTELLRACLKLLAAPARPSRVYAPPPLPLWRVPDALALLRAALARQTGEAWS